MPSSQREHAVDHLADRLALDRQAGRRRIGHADARQQQAHVVVDLGDGADRRARVLRGGLLLDRDGRRQAVDLVDVRLLHHLQELARIGRQALDIAALAFGIDRVEGERRLAGAGQAGDHDQAVARQVEVDVLEIVLARAADRDHTGIAAGSVHAILHSVFLGSRSARQIGWARSGHAARTQGRRHVRSPPVRPSVELVHCRRVPKIVILLRRRHHHPTRESLPGVAGGRLAPHKARC